MAQYESNRWELECRKHSSPIVWLECPTHCDSGHVIVICDNPMGRLRLSALQDLRCGEVDYAWLLGTKGMLWQWLWWVPLCYGFEKSFSTLFQKRHQLILEITSELWNVVVMTKRQEGPLWSFAQRTLFFTQCRLGSCNVKWKAHEGKRNFLTLSPVCSSTKNHCKLLCC